MNLGPFTLTGQDDPVALFLQALAAAGWSFVDADNADHAARRFWSGNSNTVRTSGPHIHLQKASGDVMLLRTSSNDFVAQVIPAQGDARQYQSRSGRCYIPVAKLKELLEQGEVRIEFALADRQASARATSTLATLSPASVGV